MKVFLTGAGGYLGGSVAAHLAARGYSVRGLIRDSSRADELRSHGIQPVVGVLDDGALLAEEAHAADAVVNAADSDHRGAVESLLDALGSSGKRFIHTSGTSLIGDEALGESSSIVFTEDTPIFPMPDKLPRMEINNMILAAAPAVHSVVLCNSLVYGHALGPRAQSVQLPALAEVANEAGVALHVGRGRNRWSTVHIADLADLYLLALNRTPAGSFYFVENGESSFKDMADAIGQSLGVGPARYWAPDDAIARFGRRKAVFSLGSNSRVLAERARAELGWKPSHGSVIDFILAEM